MDTDSVGTQYIICECGDNFPNEKLLNIHLANGHGDVDIFQCDSCPEIFTSNAVLLKHRQQHEKQKEKLSPKRPLKTYSDKTATLYKTNVADVKSTENEQQKKKTPVIKLQNLKRIDSLSLIQKLKNLGSFIKLEPASETVLDDQEAEMPVEPEITTKIITEDSGNQVQVKSEVGEVNEEIYYQCDVCNTIFYTEADFDVHYQSTHAMKIEPTAEEILEEHLVTDHIDNVGVKAEVEAVETAYYYECEMEKRDAGVSAQGELLQKTEKSITGYNYWHRKTKQGRRPNIDVYADIPPDISRKEADKIAKQRAKEIRKEQLRKATKKYRKSKKYLLKIAQAKIEEKLVGTCPRKYSERMVESRRRASAKYAKNHPEVRKRALAKYRAKKKLEKMMKDCVMETGSDESCEGKIEKIEGDENCEEIMMKMGKEVGTSSRKYSEKYKESRRRSSAKYAKKHPEVNRRAVAKYAAKKKLEMMKNCVMQTKGDESCELKIIKIEGSENCEEIMTKNWGDENCQGKMVKVEEDENCDEIMKKMETKVGTCSRNDSENYRESRLRSSAKYAKKHPEVNRRAAAKYAAKKKLEKKMKNCVMETEGDESCEGKIIKIEEAENCEEIITKTGGDENYQGKMVKVEEDENCKEIMTKMEEEVGTCSRKYSENYRESRRRSSAKYAKKHPEVNRRAVAKYAAKKRLEMMTNCVMETVSDESCEGKMVKTEEDENCEEIMMKREKEDGTCSRKYSENYRESRRRSSAKYAKKHPEVNRRAVAKYAAKKKLEMMTKSCDMETEDHGSCEGKVTIEGDENCEEVMMKIGGDENCEASLVKTEEDENCEKILGL